MNRKHHEERSREHGMWRPALPEREEAQQHRRSAKRRQDVQINPARDTCFNNALHECEQPYDGQEDAGNIEGTSMGVL